MLNAIFSAIFLDLKLLLSKAHNLVWNKYTKVFGPHIFGALWFAAHWYGFYYIFINEDCGCKEPLGVFGSISVGFVAAALSMVLEWWISLGVRQIFIYYKGRLV